jgi:hypothetical protein
MTTLRHGGSVVNSFANRPHCTGEPLEFTTPELIAGRDPWPRCRGLAAR